MTSVRKDSSPKQLFGYYKAMPNHLKKHPPPFETTHSNSDIHGDVNKKGEIDEVFN